MRRWIVCSYWPTRALLVWGARLPIPTGGCFWTQKPVALPAAVARMLFSLALRSNEDIPHVEAPIPSGTEFDPTTLVERALAERPALIFGQRPGSLSGRRPRSRRVVLEQASLFNPD